MKKGKILNIRGAKNKTFIMLTSTLLLITVVGGSLLEWYRNSFGVSIEEILFTIDSPLTGADIGFLNKAIYAGLGGLLLWCSLIVLLCSMMREYSNGYAKIVMLAIGIIGAIGVLVDADSVFMVTDFIQARIDTTMIYENYYIAPDPVAINAEKPRNLLRIYMESMETTYASFDEGGYQKINYIPNLTSIANENISFSNNDKLGGFHCCTGSGWTMGALFTAEAGIPFSFPTHGNAMGQREQFAKGVVTLGDILKEKGYYQEFLCGSDGNFAGRKKFFEQHGDYNVYDVYSATKDGYISEDEYVNWGMEDKDLYKVAKYELTRVSEMGQPFNLTMLTVDTHHEEGWLCELCEDKYPEQMGNVVDCADRQIVEFLKWCEEQLWYEETTIIIQGDHPFMGKKLVQGVDYYDRTVYNCFINTPLEENVNSTYREFTGFDMLPTVLASIGFDIPSNKLGLGTNLFSDIATLCEELGFEYVDGELSKYSEYYKHFY